MVPSPVTHEATDTLLQSIYDYKILRLDSEKTVLLTVFIFLFSDEEKPKTSVVIFQKDWRTERSIRPF